MLICPVIFFMAHRGRQQEALEAIPRNRWSDAHTHRKYLNFTWPQRLFICCCGSRPKIIWHNECTSLALFPCNLAWRDSINLKQNWAHFLLQQYRFSNHRKFVEPLSSSRKKRRGGILENLLAGKVDSWFFFCLHLAKLRQEHLLFDLKPWNFFTTYDPTGPFFLLEKL